MHAEHADFGEVMSHVRGAVIVRRPDLTETSEAFVPANRLDFVETLKAYFPIFESSLFDK